MVRKLTESPARVVEADLTLLSEAGWSEPALLDAICISGMAGYMNRFVDGSGVHLAPAEEELIAGTLSKPGSYANLSRLLARLTSES